MNSFLKNLSMNKKFMLLIFLMLAGFLVIAFGSAMFLKESLVREKELKTRELVETASGILGYYDNLAKTGKITVDTAKAEAMTAVGTLRYDNQEYFWINDLQCKMIMHPIKPELDGKDLSDFKDPNGKRIFSEFTDLVKKSGSGFVRYMWPKPNHTEPMEKLSYVQGFEPWGWVVGSGIYIDDVNAVIWQKLGKLLPCVVLIMALILLSWKIASNITGTVKVLSIDAEKIASGDLSVEVDYHAQDEIGLLADSFRRMIANLKSLIGKISQSSELVATAATQLSSASEQIATGAEQVAAQAGIVTTASEEMSQTSSEIARNCGIAAGESESAKDTAHVGSGVVDGTISVMHRIAEKVKESSKTVESLGSRSDQIGAIIGTIEDIADQTNLLALNAAIEAARAGEHGRGFAVVADEVRALAERTTKATSEIGAMIRAIQHETKGAVDAMEERVREVEAGTAEAAKSGEALEEIQKRINAVTMQVTQIATAAEEQTNTIGDITSNIQQITEVMYETAKEAKESSTSASQLNTLANELHQLTGQFRIAEREAKAAA